MASPKPARVVKAAGLPRRFPFLGVRGQHPASVDLEGFTAPS